MADEEKKKNKTSGCLIALVMWAIFIYFIIKIFTGWWNDLDTNNNNSSNTSNDYKIEAYAMSQEFIEDYLIAPSTAKFPWYSSINVIQTGNRYKVEAYVDSQNDFGGTIRTKYYMILERDSNGGWTKISCDLK